MQELRKIKNTRKMRQELKVCYEKCDACTMHRNSGPQKSNEISMSNLFNNFYPNQRVQIDFCEKGRDDYLVMVDVMSGFFQVYKVKNKSASEAVIRDLFGFRTRISTDI